MAPKPKPPEVQLASVEEHQAPAPVPVAAAVIEQQPAAAPAAAMPDCGACGRDVVHCGCDYSWSISVDYLFWQVKGADLGFAYISDVCDGVPLGPTQQLDFDFQSGIRYGVWKTVTPGETWVGFTGTHFAADTSASGPVLPVGQIFVPTLLVSPRPLNCDLGASTVAEADGNIDYDTFDLDYRQLLHHSELVDVTGLVGVRIASLDQSVRAVYDLDIARAASDLRGAGVRFGLGAARNMGCWRAYGNTNLSILNTDSDLEYTQTEILSGDNVVDFVQDIDRVVPILDIELGLTRDICRNVSFTIGYQYSVWWNVVTVPELVSTLQDGDFSGDTEDDITFDGFFARVEVRY
jgi:hypothetical protein